MTPTPDPTWTELAAQLLETADPAAQARLIDQMHAAYLAAPSPLAGTTPSGLPYPSPTDPIAQGADAIRSLAEALEQPRILKRFYTPVSVTLTTANVNLPGVTMDLAVKAGQKFNVIAKVLAWNAASGNPKTATFRIAENGVNLAPTGTFSLPFIVGSSGASCFVEVPRTAAADGVLTYTVGGMANAASSCTVTECALEAISMPAGSTQAMAETSEEDLLAMEEALRAERSAAGVE